MPPNHGQKIKLSCRVTHIDARAGSRIAVTLNDHKQLINIAVVRHFRHMATQKCSASGPHWGHKFAQPPDPIIGSRSALPIWVYMAPQSLLLDSPLRPSVRFKYHSTLFPAKILANTQKNKIMSRERSRKI